MLCSTCHTEIPDDATTCPNCGAAVAYGSAAAAPARRRRLVIMRITAALASLVVIASTGFGLWSWHQHRSVETSYRQAQANESEALAAKAEQLLAQGDRLDAIQVAMAALPKSSAGDDRPLVPAAQLALERALQVYPQSSLWRSCYSVKEVTESYALSPDGLQAFEGIDGKVTICSADDGSRTTVVDPRGQIAEASGAEVGAITLRFVGDQLLCSSQDGLALFDAASGSLSWRAAIEGFAPSSDIIASSDAEHLVIGCSFGPAHVIGDNRSDEVIVRIINAHDGSVGQGFKLPLNPYGEHTNEVRLAYSDDGGTLAVANSGRLWLIDLATSDVVWADLPGSAVDQLAFEDQEIVVVCRSATVTDDYASVASTTQVACYARDPYLYHLWSLALDAEGDTGEDGFANARIQGVWSADDEPRIVITHGQTASLVDMLTGEVVWEVMTSSPIRGAMLDKGIYLVDHDGNVEVYVPGDDEATNLAPLTVQEGERASFAVAKGYPCLAVFDADGSTYRIYRLMGRAVAPSRTLYQSKYLHTHLETIEAAEAGRLVMSGNEDEVAALDATTLKRQWKRSFAKLGLEKSICNFACGKDAVYVYEAEHKTKGAPVICVISPEDGSTLDRIELPKDWGSIEELSEEVVGDSTKLIIRDQGTAGIIDVATHEEQMRVTAASGMIYGTWLGTDTLLVLESPAYGATNNSFELFSLSDGSPTSAQICSCAVRAGDTGRLVTIDPTGSVAAVSCADGIIRTFDTADWSVVWEGVEELSNLSLLSYAPDGSTLFAQDTSGSCLLLSASDAHVLRATTAVIPTIDKVVADTTNPHRVVATYRLGEAAGEVGILQLSLDPDCFGPLSETFSGLYYTADGQQVLAYDAASEPAFSTYHHYTLDELLELGQQAIVGHELTDAERRLYRIAS